MEPALQTTSTLRHSYVEQGRRESTARIACLATRTDIFLLTSIPFIPYGKTSSSAMSVPWQTSFFVFFTSWPIVLPPKLLLLFPFEPPRRELTPGLHLLSYQSVGRGGSAGRSGNLSPRFSHVLGAELRAFPRPRTRCSTNQPSHLSRNLQEKKESAFSFHSYAFFCWWHQLAPRMLWTLPDTHRGSGAAADRFLALPVDAAPSRPCQTSLIWSVRSRRRGAHRCTSCPIYFFYLPFPGSPPADAKPAVRTWEAKKRM